MSTSSKQILHFGLAGNPGTVSAVSGLKDEEIRKKVTEGAEKARNAGFEVQLTFVTPDGLDEALGKVRKELETGKWDALVIGGGLRFTLDLTPQFEQVVNIAREAAPKTKILFQMAPGDIYETVERGFR